MIASLQQAIRGDSSDENEDDVQIEPPLIG